MDKEQFEDRMDHIISVIEVLNYQLVDLRNKLRNIPEIKEDKQ